MITDHQKFTTELTLTLYRILFFIFTVIINSKSFPWATLRLGNVPTQIFGNVRCPILRIKTNSMPQCWCCLATDMWKKSRLNWELKISNAADDVDITQSQELDTRHRRMQEVNCLCMESGPLRSTRIVSFHIIQPSRFQLHSDHWLSMNEYQNERRVLHLSARQCAWREWYNHSSCLYVCQMFTNFKNSNSEVNL